MGHNSHTLYGGRKSRFIHLTMLPSLEIKFGRFTFSLSPGDNKTIKYLKEHYSICQSYSSPDLSISIEFIPSHPPSLGVERKPYEYTFTNNQFNFGSGLITGNWDSKKKTCSLSVDESLFTPKEIWLFDRFLCRIFYTLSLEERVKGEEELIIHGTGILKDGKGYVFFGPPESGKSTVAQLSHRFQVLHDDMILVNLTENEVSIEGVPFNPKVVERRNGRGELSKIFSLHKSEKTMIEKGSPEEFIRKVLPEIFLPQPLLSEDRKGAFQYMLNFATKLGERIPYYRLFFKKDESFWRLIE